MLEIFQFYLSIVVQIFNRVLNSFEVTSGLGFGTFLLGCSLFVVFINLIKFRYGTDGFAEIRAYQNYKNELNAKHRERGLHEVGGYKGRHDRYIPNQYFGKHSSRSIFNRRLDR